LQVAHKAQVRSVRIAGHICIYQGASHDSGDMVYQRVMHAAVRNMDHAMPALLKQPDLGRAQAAADGETRTVAKSGAIPGNDREVRQAVNTRQLLQRAARRERDARLTEPRAAGAWRPMRAFRQTNQPRILPQTIQDLPLSER